MQHQNTASTRPATVTREMPMLFFGETSKQERAMAGTVGARASILRTCGRRVSAATPDAGAGAARRRPRAPHGSGPSASLPTKKTRKATPAIMTLQTSSSAVATGRMPHMLTSPMRRGQQSTGPISASETARNKLQWKCQCSNSLRVQTAMPRFSPPAKPDCTTQEGRGDLMGAAFCHPGGPR